MSSEDRAKEIHLISSTGLIDLNNQGQKAMARDYALDGLEEHEVVEQFIIPAIKDLLENAVRILEYGSSEMINNAIDHSGGTKVRVGIIFDPTYTRILIHDDGVGIFNKIQRGLGLDSPHDAILELCKGKLTTDPSRHTGEGIFFTSRACDSFFILSDKLDFGHLNEEDWLQEEMSNPQTGTLVSMTINRDSKRNLTEVFDHFASKDEDFGFTKTHFPIAIAQYGPDGLMSRSKARRVLNRFSKFKEVILDFKGVDFIGQAFADEIFRVYRKIHPDINISVINVNENVKKMIKRALASDIEKNEADSAS